MILSGDKQALNPQCVDAKNAEDWIAGIFEANHYKKMG